MAMPQCGVHLACRPTQMSTVVYAYVSADGDQHMSNLLAMSIICTYLLKLSTFEYMICG